MADLLPPPTREQWQGALCWAMLQLTHGVDGHHVRRNETWDTAILRVAAGRLVRHRLPIVDIPRDNVQAVLQREYFDDLQRVAAAELPSEDGKAQGPRKRRVRPRRRRGWAA